MLMSWRKCSRDMTRTEFEHISVLIRGRIVALARRFARAADLPDPAEDIAQETLEALWRLCEKGYPVRDSEALAVKIAKNICVMHYRRRRIVPDSIGGMDFEGGFPATERTDRDDIEAVRERLYATLSKTQRQYMEMRNGKGMSLDEISAATGRPKSSIKVTISAARRQLLEKLEKEVL